LSFQTEKKLSAINIITFYSIHFNKYNTADKNCECKCTQTSTANSVILSKHVGTIILTKILCASDKKLVNMKILQLGIIGYKVDFMEFV